MVCSNNSTHLNSLKYYQTLRLFFDFYVINELWSRTIGLEEFGYKEYKILPYGKQEKIQETFESRVKNIKERVISCLEKSVRGEIRHFQSSGPARPGYNHNFGYRGYIEYKRAKDFKKAKNLIDVYGGNKKNWPLNIIHYGFSMKGWQWQFGGKKWAKATDYLIQLKNSKDYKNDVFLIDRIFDLEHNTNYIFSKVYLGCLNYNFPIDYRKKLKIKQKNPLDYRFHASIEDMSRLCSGEVREIYTANKNYLKINY